MMRQAKGSHEIWSSPAGGTSFAVPVDIANRHTATAILKQAF